jgi:glycosyltransferase involved in cell wall biosynthesis
MIKVSVGVAIYNSEKYLRQCLDSLVNQTLQDIEIILVSDASPDESIGIMREYENKYPDKVKVIELEKNTRLSGTRKAAMDIARGEFFGYVDGDDFVDITMYEKLYTLAIEEEADAAACWICDFDDAIGKKNT